MSRNGSGVLEVRIRIVGRGHVFRLRRCHPLLSSSNEAPGWYPSGFVTPLNEPHETSRSLTLRRLPRRFDIRGKATVQCGSSPRGNHSVPASGRVPPRLPSPKARCPLPQLHPASECKCRSVDKRGKEPDGEKKKSPPHSICKMELGRTLRKRTELRPGDMFRLQERRGCLKKRHGLRSGWCVPPAGAQ